MAQSKPIAQGIDITGRKLAEKALLREKDFSDAVMYSSPGLLFVFDDKDNIIQWNRNAEEVTGYSAKEIAKMNILDFVANDDQKTAAEAMQEVFTKGRSSLEINVLSKSGKKTPFHITGLRTKFENTTHVVCTGIDITERKQAEEALRQSEERYRNIIETMEDAYFEVDLAGNFTFVNDAQCRISGSPRERLLGMNNRAYTTKEEAKKLYEIFNGIYRTEKPVSRLGYEFTKKDGTKTFNELSASLIRNSQGKPIGFRGASRDVTERKRAEEALRKSEEKYRSILANITEGYFENDLHGNLIFLNDSLPEIYGYTRDELLHMNYRQFMDEENARKVSQAYNKVYTIGEPDGEIQFEIIRKDGTKRYLENSVSLIRDAGGQPVGFRGIARDVTARRQMEEALRESEDKYRTILDSIGDSYTEIDLSGTTTFINHAGYKFLGWTREEFVGMNYKKYSSPENAKKLFEIYSKVYRTGEPARLVELELAAKDGTTKIVETTIDLRRDKSGKPMGFKTIARDITQRRRTEEALRQSEERYRTIIENIQDGYFEDDLAGKYTFVNDVICQHLGYSKEELIGMNSRQYQDEANAKKTHQAFNGIYRTGEPVKALEMEVIRKDGTKGFSEISVSLIRDAEGKPIGFRGISRDITERKEAEEALRQSEERYRTIIENIQDGYFEDDLAGKFVFINDVICGHLGYSREELIGMSNRLFQDEINAQKANQAFKEVYETGEPVKALDMEIIRKDGTKGISEVSVSLIRDVQGKPIGFRGISRDITERKEAAEQLRRYATELERSNEEVKNFAYIVSHDLRVPLVNLKGYTSELRSALGVIGSNFDAALPHLIDEKRSAVAMALHEDVPEALEFITNSVSRMDSFINSILILARLGRQDLKPEPIDMNALVKTTLGTMSHQLQERGIEVIVGSLPHVAADRTAMEQIIGNILSNAVKYLDSSRPGRIEVTAQANGAETTFRIRDNGRGIAQEDMHKVFAPFRRAGKQDTQGEGMGLAYVQTLVRRHGGRISCESELGKGTTFTFTISTRSEKGARDA